MQVRRKCVPLHPQSREMALKHAEIAQLVEHNLAKVGVAGPSPVFRSFECRSSYRRKVVITKKNKPLNESVFKVF